MKQIVMKKETIDLKLLNYFVVTAETLSFTAASVALGIPKSVLSKGIARLEAELGAKVFERSSRVVRLTESGQILYRRANALLDEADHLINDLKTMRHSVSGRLKLAAPPLLGRLLAKEIIPQFLARWPEVSISLKLSLEFENLFTEGLDLAFRMGKNRDERLIERPLGKANRVVVASPDYLANCAPIHTPQGLVQHKSLQIFEQQPHIWTLQKGAQIEQVALPVAFQCSDLAALVNATSAGLGVAQLPWLLVRDEIQTGKLVHVLPEWLSAELPISLVYREGHNKSARLAEFLNWIDQQRELFDLRFPGAQ
jgi:DNA-binding transcriptional LysR family regulator